MHMPRDIITPPDLYWQLKRAAFASAKKLLFTVATMDTGGRQSQVAHLRLAYLAADEILEARTPTKDALGTMAAVRAAGDVSRKNPQNG